MGRDEKEKEIMWKKSRVGGKVIKKSRAGVDQRWQKVRLGEGEGWE